MPQCVAGTGPNDVWSYCPSLAAAILFAVLFGITSTAHITQAFLYRKPFAWVLIMGALWETGGYIVRIISIYNPLTSGIYTGQLLLILLAPLWINAYIYMLLGRMIHFFLESDRVFKIKARLITRMFVCFDITAFLIQATGGTMTGPGSSNSTQKLGLDIYTAGVGVQLGFLVIFVSLAIGFQQKLKNHSRSPNDIESTTRLATYNGSPNRMPSPSPLPAMPDAGLARPLLRTLYIVMTLIILRNLYRLIEFAMGANSPTVTHEWFAYVFDAVPMFCALVVLNVWNPGKLLQGPGSDFSGQDKERKQAKKDKKVAKKQERQDKKEMKKMSKLGLGKGPTYEPVNN
ncbi:RTA1 like protein-domain-containing protein [Exophiala viscosa]|uniref:RTA1 like protein-domain-containing protein n=1 Tax=Exophiala viscosa TaxID=2486360 RepID=A0AAN6E3Y5_9EURO|nr:RTA1 like protein-domain-containing protein [Exophiala viscosa]